MQVQKFEILLSPYKIINMKKLILFVALSVCSLASAQKVTDKDLQGNWKLTGLSTNGISLDIATGVVVISDELKAQLTPEITTQINDGMKQAAEQLKNSSTTFTGTTLKQNIGGQEKSGTYTLKDVNGTQIMTATWSDATTSETSVWIKEKKLHISKSEQGQTAELVFVKA
jgi:hypothetical protein